ncbi:hypothetical protein AERO8C_30315 [Aeromonas veronii]|uniref:Uncharacterized protein n=1 Tax=Aeromonas veronii TaxID=654 RepID=A0A653L559_AERVE|nr:hypothetical protein AERO8C_30315 [Aeromonas veronii]
MFRGQQVRQTGLKWIINGRFVRLLSERAFYRAIMVDTLRWKGFNARRCPDSSVGRAGD